MLLASGLVIVGGIVVCCRQVFVVVLFNDEEPLFRENRFRVVNLMGTVSVVAVVAVVIAAVARYLLSSFDVSVCFVDDGTVPPRAGYLLVLPVIVHIGLGVAFVAQAKCPETRRKQSPSVHMDVSCEKHVEQSTLAVQDGRIELSDSRWKRFILVVSVGVITWFIIGVSIVMAGVYGLPPSGGTLVLVSGYAAACSVWSAVSVFRCWT